MFVVNLVYPKGISLTFLLIFKVLLQCTYNLVNNSEVLQVKLSVLTAGLYLKRLLLLSLS